MKSNTVRRNRIRPSRFRWGPPLAILAAFVPWVCSAGGAPAQDATTVPDAGRTPAEGPSPGGPAAPTADPSPAIPQENWTVNCTGDAAARTCSIIQNLVTDQQQRLLTLLVQADAKGQPSLLLVLPHGLFLPAGVQIRIDGGKPQKLVIQTADENGGYAGVPITPPLLATLRKGQELNVTFFSAQQNDITVPVTLAGFSRAYDNYLTKSPTAGGMTVATPALPAPNPQPPAATPSSPAQ